MHIGHISVYIFCNIAQKEACFSICSMGFFADEFRCYLWRQRFTVLPKQMKQRFDIWIILITEMNVRASLSFYRLRLLCLFCSQSSDYFNLRRFFYRTIIFFFIIIIIIGKPAGSLQGLLSIRALWSSYIAVLWLNPDLWSLRFQNCGVGIEMEKACRFC